MGMLEKEFAESGRDDSWISHELGQLSALGLLRSPKTRSAGSGARIELQGKSLINFSSNDYLGLSQEPALAVEAAETGSRWGTGSGASRVVSGTHPSHEALENALAAAFGSEGCLVYGSGYLANLGSIPVLARRNDSIFVDRLAHASLIDGIQLSRSKFRRFQHNDPSHLESLMKQAKEKRRASERFLIVTESVFSMDGDLAPLREIAALAERYDAMLYVDEAHAIGVYGQNGAGLVSELGIESSAITKSLSFGKALASYGGAVLGTRILRELLLQKSRTFIFHTALPPAVPAATCKALTFLSDPWRRDRLRKKSLQLRAKLRSAGLSVPDGDSAIVPLFVPGNARCISFSSALFEAGVFAPAIRSPSVPAGTERIRISLSATHSDAELEEAGDLLIECGEAAGLLP